MTHHNSWTKLERARISRRRALGGAAALVASAYGLPFAGCDDDNAGGASDAPRRGGTLRTGTTLALASGLDPHTETGGGLAIFARLYGYLVHLDSRDESVIYDHAASIEQPDALTYVFKLRDGLRFHDLRPVDGRAITAADVARSFERFREHRLVANKTWHATVLDRVDAPDDATVRITTRIPYAYSLGEIGGISGGAILPAEVIDQNIDLTRNAIGSGPFRLEEMSSDRVRLARNDAYWASPLPNLDAMEWHIYDDDAAKRRAFERGDIDVVVNRDRNEADQLRAVATEVEVDRAPSLASIGLGMRVDRPPFGDPRVRRAIDLALDRDALIRDLAAGDGEILGAVNPHLAGGYWSLPAGEVGAAQRADAPVEERLAEARTLVAAALGTPASFTLQVARLPQLIDVATVVREQLLQLGFSIVLRELDLLEWYGNFRRGDFEATLISHLPYESPDIPLRFYHSRGPAGDASPFGFSDAVIDALVERAWGEPDREARRESVLGAQRLALEARPLLPLFTSAGYSSARSYVRDRGGTLPGSLAQYHHAQWLAPAPASD